jgi:hypothetical protein
MPKRYSSQSLIPVERIVSQIYLVRGHKVMLDRDLASLYGVPTKALNQAIKRNLARFPEDFMFQLSKAEMTNLRSQTVTSGWGGRRYLPYVFTQEGVAMLSSVLRSARAIQMNIVIMRAFVRIRELMATNKDVARRLQDIERRQDEQDEKIDGIVQVIEVLMEPDPAPRSRRIGFKTDDKKT